MIVFVDGCVVVMNGLMVRLRGRKMNQSGLYR